MRQEYHFVKRLGRAAGARGAALFCVVPELLAKCGSGACEPRLDRTHRAAHNLCDLRLRQPLEIKEDNRTCRLR